MKLDARLLRYLSNDDFRVLTAVEMGSRNHEIVPTSLIASIACLKSGSIHKIISNLARNNLIAKMQNAKYDGYRLTYGGYDYLALKALSRRDSVQSIGSQIGIGKESDILIVANDSGEQIVMKLHRLGRTSFRNIKEKRDYLRNRKTTSWLYMSRLAAMKEYAFMQVLYEHGFPVPRPIDQNRHCILMELIDAIPLSQVSEVADPGKLYSDLMDLIVRLAQSGLIHGDFNEFNLLVTRDTARPVLIDFPQMVSTRHANAKMYFDRDVNCIRTFFQRRFGYIGVLYPVFSEYAPGSVEVASVKRLDDLASASGFSLQLQTELERMLEEVDSQRDGLEEEAADERDELEEEAADERVGGLDSDLDQLSSASSSGSSTSTDLEGADETLPESCDSSTLETREILQGLDIHGKQESLPSEEDQDRENEDAEEVEGEEEEEEDESDIFAHPRNEEKRPHRLPSSNENPLEPSAFSSGTHAEPRMVPKKTVGMDKAKVRRIVQQNLERKGRTGKSSGGHKNYTKRSRATRESASDFFF